MQVMCLFAEVERKTVLTIYEVTKYVVPITMFDVDTKT
jgi:hypothetical protein